MGQYVLINGRIYDRNELAHHGIKGMRWGVRRFQTKDGSLTPAGKKRYVTTAQGVRNAKQAAEEARKKSLAESRATESGIGSYRRAMNKASSAANEAYRNSIAKDKAYNKQLREEKKADKVKTTKAAVKDYNKSFDDWNKSQELADAKWNEVSEQYKSLGKTRVTRILNAARNNTDAAKAYNKSYNSWESSQNIADKKWTEVSEKYKKTGRNRVGRILNNVRYG